MAVSKDGKEDDYKADENDIKDNHVKVEADLVDNGKEFMVADKGNGISIEASEEVDIIEEEDDNEEYDNEEYDSDYDYSSYDSSDYSSYDANDDSLFSDKKLSKDGKKDNYKADEKDIKDDHLKVEADLVDIGKEIMVADKGNGISIEASEEDEVQARVVAATQAAEESSDLLSVDMSQLYMEVVGGTKKQRIYGLGTKAISFRSPARPSPTLRTYPDVIKRHVLEELHQQFEQRYQDMEARVEALVDARHQDQLSSILVEMHRTGHVPPFVQSPTRPNDVAN
ncbi:hypothetical protein DH2020_045125 [Rehmannia glutinosa]|uniref:Uncharacterized protein n=1 Tax=Rehmannia glutinosa TaxID=99300 RepID=A0ABR0UFR4_REHGL